MPHGARGSLLRAARAVLLTAAGCLGAAVLWVLFAGDRRDPVALLFLGAGILITWLIVSLHQARGRAQHAHALEDALRRHADELAEIDRRKDIFLATLGHELRTPLAPLRWAVALLERRLGDHPELRTMLPLLERPLQHLARLVDDLVDSSRIRRGLLELRRQPIDLTTVVHNAVESVRPLIEDRRHKLSVTSPDEPVILEGDPLRLGQVVTNLLHNAARYTPAGGQILLNVSREGAQAVLSIEDTGTGIAAEMLERIFEPFQQGEAPPDTPRQGLGLGLALARQLVELHGGTLTASSPGPGCGSVFSIRLPAPVHLPSPPPQPPQRPPVATPGRRVLVVDDNLDTAHSLSLFLEAYGHEVRVAGDGPETLELTAEWLPEVVFLDIGLPGMDGYEVAQELRRRLGKTAPRLVALTGHGRAEDRLRGEEAGFDAYLVKPTEPEAVLRLLAAGVR